ncbi:MAG: AMP-binding protein, partial [Alphaproteobacteria bacterium]|nr:AMP-binding protein [Alphaproteobacteria bacterium]
MSLKQRIVCEWIYFVSIVRLLLRLKAILRRPGRTIGDQIADLARRHGDRPALIGEDSILSYRALDALANRYARWAREAGMGKGDVVALMMQNRPDYLAAWIGISRIGGVTALINTQQRGDSLAHSLRIVAPRHLILDAELADSYETARDHLATPPQAWTFGGAGELDAALDRLPDEPLDAGERAGLTIEDPCLYIYTSGTTGLPKAATISHYRVMAVMNGFSSVMRATFRDRIYVPLPLYHSSGGLLGVGATLTVGGSAIVRRTFSAREFWPDCVRHEATLFQYIGELCRYLVNAEPCPEEKRHRLRLACGN